MVPIIPTKAIADAVIEAIANGHDHSVREIAKLVVNGWGFVEPMSIYDYERRCRAF